MGKRASYKTNPPLKVYIYDDSNKTRNNTSFAEIDVIITPYSSIRDDVTKEDERGPFSRLKFHCVVLDEAHIIKNCQSLVSQAYNRLDADFRWCITRSPIVNRIEDMFPLFTFLYLSAYSNFEKFNNDILKPFYNGGDKHNVKTYLVISM
ncbi:SNF2 family N-terminal domain-containing protein [Circinella umbellata]|nr:SNF2 family N-terminal domain-containing protein [Circinella umbellata]